MKELFVCEKPSQAQMYAEALCQNVVKKKGYLIGDQERYFTYAFGHLVSATTPEALNWKADAMGLPLFQKELELHAKADTKEQYEVIKGLMKQAPVIIIASDAGREGEHIFRKIYKLSGVKKPLKRLWVQDSTNEGITKAYAQMKDGAAYDNLAVAGQLREEADLLIGLNATIMSTKLSGSSSVLSLGRVQTPTLSMIVQRDLAIESFKKVTHYTIIAPVDKKVRTDKVFKMKLEKEERLSKQEAETILNGLNSRQNFQRAEQEKKEAPKALFDLTSLQMHMNEKHGWSAKKTLDVLQKLYETHKAVTYPRTSSKYLASDAELPEILQAHAEDERANDILEKGYRIDKRFVNPKKVTDHEAVVLTKQQPKQLNADEQTLYEEVRLRFFAAFYPPARYQEVLYSFSDHTKSFEMKDKTLVDPGWKALYGETASEQSLTPVQLENVGEYQLKEEETSPPKRYTEKTLLGDMENASKFLEEKEDKEMIKGCGIGTPATRASIIELLVQRNFIEKKKNKGKETILSTTLGRELIHMMPESFSLYNVDLTAQFETMLAEVEEGKRTKEAFYQELEALVQTLSNEIKQNVKAVQGNEKEKIADCPSCGSPIHENKKGYGCSGFKKGCKTIVWKTGLERFGKKNITKTEAKKLLSGNTFQAKLKSKKGAEYKKEVSFNVEKNYVEVHF